MDSAPWPQEIVVKPMDEIIVANARYHQKPPPSSSSSDSSVLERKVRTQKNQQALSCPRCHSTNTKFCYYNNYSLTQPRYICKTCRRYWTEGGSLRNIPVGGGSRKNKRSANNSSSADSPAVIGASSCKKILTAGGLLLPPLPGPITQQNPNGKIHESSLQDLNLGFSTSYTTDHDDPSYFKSLAEMIQVPNFESNKNILKNRSALELSTGLTGSRGLENCGYMPMIMSEATGSGANSDHLHHHNLNTVYSTGFPLSAEFMKAMPSDLNFSLDGLGSNYGSFQGVQENTDGKLLFPFEDLKTHKFSSNNANDADHQQESRTQNGNDSNGFWNGVIERGTW